MNMQLVYFQGFLGSYFALRFNHHPSTEDMISGIESLMLSKYEVHFRPSYSSSLELDCFGLSTDKKINRIILPIFFLKGRYAKATSHACLNRNRFLHWKTSLEHSKNSHQCLIENLYVKDLIDTTTYKKLANRVPSLLQMAIKKVSTSVSEEQSKLFLSSSMHERVIEYQRIRQFSFLKSADGLPKRPSTM